MTDLRALPFAAFLLLAPAVANAQPAPDQSAPASLNNQQNSSESTHPDNMGNTGWTGGRQDTQKGSDQGPLQPPVATGEDLKGPSTQFTSGKTPE